MATIEERVAYLEGRMQDHTALWDNLRDSVIDLRADMNRRFEEVRTEFADVRSDMNRRFEEVRADMNRQFAEIQTDMNRQFGEVRGELATQRSETERRFLWLTGIFVTTALGTLGAVIGLYFK